MSVIEFRTATEVDLPVLVDLLADDPLGSTRESATEALSPAYLDAFREITGDPNHELLVADLDGDVAGFLQLSYLPHLTYTGRWRAQIEGVRVEPSRRSQGVGRALIEEAISRARARDCHLVQLTTDRRRPDALRFYTKLGFDASHEGLKLHL